MLNKNKKEKLLTRRLLILAGLKTSLLLSLIGRLYYLQVVKSTEYKTFSDSNRIKLFLLPPLRGKILDRNGDLFSGNKNFYRILFDPEVSSNNDKVVKKLAQLLNFNDKQYKQLLSRVRNLKSGRPITLYEHLTWKEVSKVEVNVPDLPGISIDVGQIRYFPTEEISSHVVGYMGPVSEGEIAVNPLLNHPDFKIGRYGIEKSLEQKLRGDAGVKRMEVNAHGLSIRELSREESKPGQNVELTLDKRLQEFTGKRMDGLSGCAIIMDITTGNLLSLVSSPGFNPNEFTYGVSHDYWNELTNNDKKPLINKAISNQYPPGSTFKLIVTLAALKDGIDPNSKIHCPGHLDVGKTRFHCWKERGHGHLNMPQAIKHSCNTYFYHTSKKLGVDKIVDMAEKFGLGKEIDLILDGEKSGLVPSKQWKRDKYNVEWQLGDTLNIGIGQGYLLTTPMQLALMVARVASGKMITPNLILKTENGLPFEPIFNDIDIPQEHFELLREGMRRVVNTPGGTAYGSRIRKRKYSMAGKTGTSQVISKKGLKDNIHKMTKEEIEKTKNHALFVGYGPVENPKYAVTVVIEHGGGGSKAAAPVARDIMEQVQKLEDV